ncbi:MAG: peptide deformylase [Candidatus Lernaella stagnicola]|nr:peptide deformylase [Candidatus Lernaella stagnicola]
MALLGIHTYPDPILREKAESITEFNEDLRKFARDMAETLYAAPGIGLAANQVGVAKQVAVIDVRDDENESLTGLLTLINPKIVETEGEFVMEEGCLSLPEERAEVLRAQRVVVQAQDLDGDLVEYEAEDLLAVVFQHEIDHLNGTLFFDHISALKRSAMKKRLKKLKQQQQEVANG